MRSVTLRDYKERLLRVLVHIQEHIDDELDLEQLAHLACFSPFHFHRIFTGMVGESLSEYVRRLRLERSAAQLKLGTAPVTKIALDAGYQSHEAFTRAFRSLFHVSPSGFRAATRQALEALGPSALRCWDGKKPTHFKTSRFAGKTMKVQIVKLEPLCVAFMRHIGPYDQVGRTWDKLLPWLGKHGFLGGHCRFLGVCHDDPDVTPPGKVRYDACVTVDSGFHPTDEIGVQVIAGGEYARTTHFGSYNRLGRTYIKLLGQWLPRSGYELRSSPCFDEYLNDPNSTDPKDLLTDIYAPLASYHNI